MAGLEPCASHTFNDLDSLGREPHAAIRAPCPRQSTPRAQVAGEAIRVQLEEKKEHPPCLGREDHQDPGTKVMAPRAQATGKGGILCFLTFGKVCTPMVS